MVPVNPLKPTLKYRSDVIPFNDGIGPVSRLSSASKYCSAARLFSEGMGPPSWLYETWSSCKACSPPSGGSVPVRLLPEYEEKNVGSPIIDMTVTWLPESSQVIPYHVHSVPAGPPHPLLFFHAAPLVEAKKSRST